MSEPTDWEALGAKVQADADSKHAEEEKASLEANTRTQLDKVKEEIERKQLQAAVLRLRNSCDRAVVDFNSAIKSRNLILKIQGAANGFSITKADTRVRAVVQIEDGKIDITRHQSSQSMAGSCDQYGFRDNNFYPARHSTSLTDENSIVTPLITWLISAEWLG